MDLTKGKLGSEVVYDVKFEAGKLALEVTYDGKQADAGIVLKLEPGLFLDKLAKAIPGEVDDTVIKLLRAAFGV